MLLLDTCILVWLDTDPARISSDARRAIAGHAAALFASSASASAWEVALKVRKGKLALPMAPAAWFAEVLRLHGISEIPIDAVLAAASAELPPLHSDPFDRVIVATAAHLGASVVTPDPEIRKYPQARTIW